MEKKLVKQYVKEQMSHPEVFTLYPILFLFVPTRDMNKIIEICKNDCSQIKDVGSIPIDARLVNHFLKKEIVTTRTVYNSDNVNLVLSECENQGYDISKKFARLSDIGLFFSDQRSES